MTVIVLQGFFGILLFVLVVIFQEDLRAFFERLAMLGNLRKEARPLSELEKAAGIIAQTAANLAKKRVGALIVIAGNDPLERHFNGGTTCLLYTSDAADDLLCVDLGGRRIIKKKKKKTTETDENAP